MKIVFFFALLGCALALQAPVEYEYKYEARIGTGLHASRPRYAGTGIKADVRVTMQEEGIGEVQLKNVQVGEGNQELLDNGRDVLPISYAPIEDKSIEQPFKVYFRRQDGDTVLEVPNNDLLWVTNVRRGVANFFRIAPLVQPGSVPQPPSGSELLYGFSRIMDTFAGRCRVEYTISPASQSQSGPSIREDIQSMRAPKGPGGRQVKLEDDLHRVQASVDFSTCSDRVFLSQTGAGNLTNVTSSSYRDVASRSLVGEYILKGQVGKFRVQRGDVESAVVLQPFGIESAKMVIMSNQSMVLVAAKPAPRNVRSSSASLKPIKTWNQQLQSPKQRPQGFAPRFIDYRSQGEPQLSPVVYERLASGFQLNDQAEQASLMERAIETIKVAAVRCRQQNKDSNEQPELYRGTEDGRIAQGLMDVMHILRVINYQTLQQMDQQIQQLRDDLTTQIYIDALAAAASGPTQKMLVQKIKSHQLSDNRTASIFFNLANNIQSPEVLEELVDLAMSLQEERNVTASLLIKNNVALIIRRLCVSSPIKSYSHMMYAFGSQICQKQSIVNKYLPHLEQRIKSASKVWVQILNVIAAADLGVKESIPVLEKVARGETSQDLFVRFAAIHGLSAVNYDNSSIDQIFNVLQPIAESRVEDYRIRQVAYNSLLTFKPNVTFLQRMIFSSHNEPSQQVQSYIAWVIDSLARIEDPSYRPLSTAARNALALTRYMPASPNRPVAFFYSRYLHGDQVGSRGEEGWLSQYKSSFPREIYSYVAGKYGRFDIPLLETVTFGNSQALYAKLRSAAEEFTSKKGPSSEEERERKQRLHNQFESMHRDHLHNLAGEQQEPDIYHFSRFFRTSEVFLPLTNDLYDQTRRYMQSVLNKMGKGQQQDVAFFKYLNPVESNIILPTAPGLFMKIELNSPTVLFGQVQMQAHTSPQINDPSQLPNIEKINFRAEGIVKAITKTNTYSYVLAPWTNKTVLCGVDQEKSVSLPLKYEIEASLQAPAQIVWAQLTPKFNQTEQSPIPVIKIRNLPFTAIGGLIPTLEAVPQGSGKEHGGYQSLSPVQWFESQAEHYKVSWDFSKVNTGLSARFVYQGEPQPPFSQINVMRIVREPSRLMSLLASPSIKNYDMTIYQLNQPSVTKSIGFALRFLQQPGSGEKISQASASKPIDVSPVDPIQQREQKLQQFSDQENYEVSVQLNFTGASADQDKVYEAAIVVADTTELSQSADFQNVARKVQIALLEKNKETESLRHHKNCVVVAQVKPQLVPMPRPVHMASDQSIRSNIDANIYSGESCAASGQPSAQAQATLKVSQERLASIRNITGSIPMSQGNSSEFYKLASYDQLAMSASWKDLSPSLMNVTLRLQDLVEGYLFPKIVKNRLQQNQAGRMSVQAERFIGDNRASARIQLPQQTVEAQSLNVFALFDPIVSIAPPEVQNPSSQRLGARFVRGPSASNCLVKPDEVQTFDSVSFRKPMSGCAITALEISQGQDNIAVLTRQPSKSATGPQEVKVISTKAGLEIEVTGQNIKVKGLPMTEQSKIVKDDSGNTVAKVSKTHDIVTISLTKKMDITIKQGNLVMIKLDQRFKNIAKGLCGDYNSDTKDDLRDSKRCVYQPSEGQKYAASWVAEKSSCQETQMKNLFEQVKDTQDKCSTSRRQALFASTQCANPTNVYPISRERDGVCVGKSTIMHCSRGCHPSQFHEVVMESKCWHYASAPKVVVDNIARGYVVALPTEQPDFEHSSSQMSPSSCSRDQLATRRQISMEFGRCSSPLSVYPVTMERNQICVGQQKVSKCDSECQASRSLFRKMQSKCWSPSQAPQEVKDSQSQGYIEQLPTEHAQFVREVEHRIELHCIPKEVQQFMEQHQQNRNREYHHQMRAGNDQDCVINQAYPIKSIGPDLCIAMHPSKVCKPQCLRGDSVPTKYLSKCWSRQSAPEAVRQAEKQGYTTSPVNQDQERVQEVSIQVPISCFRQGN